jgi:hypothetical protein
MQKSCLQHRGRSIVVKASLDKRQVQLRQTVRPPATHRPLNREQKQKLVFFSQVRGGPLALVQTYPWNQ